MVRRGGELGERVAALPAGVLPPGRLVAAQGSTGVLRMLGMEPPSVEEPVRPGPAEPLYWLSSEPVEVSTWEVLRAERARSGLWPLLLSGTWGDRPWGVGEVEYEPPEDSPPSVEELLADWWEDLAEDERFLSGTRLWADWPGLASAGTPVDDRARVARECAAPLCEQEVLLGLVMAASGAQAMVECGWGGPSNYASTRHIATVVASWEERFGVEVVHLGYQTLDLSVAAPPVTLEHAAHVAVEHALFTPEIRGSGVRLLKYARGLVGATQWSFWWD